MKLYDTLGVMIDMSRNSVMSIDGLKLFFPLLKKMGYNCVMLYTEDTYEVDGAPYFGYMRGKYRKNELKEIDKIAKEYGIELIPCIQTLAHLNATIRWEQFPIDYDDIMLTDNEANYDLIDRMFASVAECFSSKKLHIGMDEAHMLGRGAHLDIHGYETAYSIISRHIERVKKIASKYGLELLMWSDMYFRFWNNGRYYADGSIEMPVAAIDAYHKDIIPVYWDYYSTDEKRYQNMIDYHFKLSDTPWFAGGIWTWQGLIPHNEFTISAMLPALKACREKGVKNVIMTMWGDFGGECSVLSVLPALHYIAEYAKGNYDEALIKKRFKRLTGLEYDDYIKIDMPNKIYDGEIIVNRGAPVNPSKYMLYSDCFNGFLDYTVKAGVGDLYAKIAKDLDAVSKKSRKFAPIFKTAAALSEVLAVKYELGVKTRAAYKKSDINELLRLANEDYSLVIKKLKRFICEYEKQWTLCSKISGFDVQELQIGATLQRVYSCRKRLIDYAKGKIKNIPELEEEILPFPDSEKETPITYKIPRVCMTPNVF